MFQVSLETFLFSILVLFVVVDPSIQFTFPAQSQRYTRQRITTRSTTIMQRPKKHTPAVEEAARKRNLEEIYDAAPPVVDLLRYGPDGQVLDLPKPVRKLRLEAIFHPKFENESQIDKEIRRHMHTAIQQGQGYLEVSLKHSGSLLLWSGGLRFYSKNSTDNVFTHVGEILLKQHFVRAFWHDDTQHAAGVQQFEECSAYVQEHRLTLSFEAVTAVAGDHGDRPERDFLILTAVADRNQERFWGTDEIVALAQRFRLPHNDAWIFKSMPAVQKLFSFYDAARETSYASNVVQAMSDASDTRVESMLPHVDFQGNILEGIVIRFVACATDSTLLDKMQELATQSTHIAAQVPPSRPDAWELLANCCIDDDDAVDSLLTVNLRDLYQKTKFGQRDGPSSFVAAVAAVMDASKIRRRVQKVPKSKADIDMPTWTRDLRHAANDVESQRIARLIELLSDINVRVDFALLREHTPGHKDRWLCIVHVIHDFSFQKYRKTMEPGDMALFRGFSFEINGKENDYKTEDSSSAMAVDAPETSRQTLMLKMKFLPYMVRTFGCRNGLNSLRQGGVEGFVKYTNNLLAKWGISTEGRLRWVPFFRGWAEYALPRMDAVMPDETDLRILTGDNYLEHLERFEALYKAGKIETKTIGGGDAESENVGLVVVVAPRQEAATSIADTVARLLGNARRLYDVNAISKQDMESLCLKGQGAVCSAKLADGTSRLRSLLGNFGKYISIIVVGCSDEEIDSDLELAQDRKMYKGHTKSWRNSRAVMVLEVAAADVFDSSNGKEGDDGEAVGTQPSSLFRNEVDKIKLVFQVDAPSGPRPGMLIFFPGIPGCGKSSVCGDETENQIQTELSKQSNDRKLILRMGDKTKGKYWPLVVKERKNDTSCLYIADKNVPSTTWGYLASICAETKAMGVPIIPDSAALQTTAIKGIRKPDGSFDDERKHIYPFSLHYLAVCLHRVILRPANSHPGKLDSGTPRACMIVVMFYSLYRRSTAEEYRENMQHHFQQAGAVLGTPIEVPFFAKRTPDSLPADLTDILNEALQTYYGYAVSKKDPLTDKDDYIVDLESRMRETLLKHTEFIQGLTADIAESRERFLKSFYLRLAELDSMESSSWAEAAASGKSNFIQITSIDVSVNDTHSLLVSLCEERSELNPLCQQLFGDASPSSVLTGDSCEDRRFIGSTHVTMAHFKESSQKAMRDTYGAIVGEQVEMAVVAVLWDERVAAIEVVLPESTIPGSTLTPSTNTFSHVTVWCQQGAQAFQSNELPTKVEQGAAHRVALAKPVTIVGELSFWTG